MVRKISAPAGVYPGLTRSGGQQFESTELPGFHFYHSLNALILFFFNLAVNRVKLEFSALRILSHPMTDSVINKILADAKEIIMQEKEVLASGRDLDELQIDKSLLLRPLPQESRDPDGGSAGSSTPNARMANVVIQAKGVNSVQRAISTYKEGRASSASGSQSKACNIL